MAQAWRDARRQVQLGRFLHRCDVLPIGMETAKAAGVLCGKAGTRDVVDAVVVTVGRPYCARLASYVRYVPGSPWKVSPAEAIAARSWRRA